MTLAPHPTVSHDAEEREHAEALLQLCKRLERAWSLPDVLEAVKPMGESVFDYRHVWLALFDEASGMLDFLTHTTSGEESAVSRQLQTMKIPVKGDALLEEILQATHVVVVEDARTDPRTNKAVVAALHNRTIVNVPLVMADQRLGALGMGTYGDEEGVRPPKPWQIALMQATAGHLAVALDRVRFMTARREAEEALVQQKEHLQVTLQSISDAVVTTDAAGLVQYLNPAAQALTGWSLAAACGRQHQDVLGLGAEPGTDTVPDLVGRALAQGSTQFHSKLRSTPLAGTPLLMDLSASPLLRPGGDADGVVLVFRDVTEASRLSREMEFQALHDTLTSLGNRRAFENLLAQAFTATRDANTARHCVCYLDLDNFKVINDTCGHAAGDELLRQVARLFLAHLQPQDLLCRLGGDEFGILLWQQDLQQALQVAERMQQELAAFRFAWRDHVFSVSVSIGAVVLDAATESVGALLQAADSACYVAKDGGRNRIHVYAENDPALAQRYGVMEWVSRIEDALQHDRFELFGQPIARLGAPPAGTAHGLHCEVLLRMRTPDGRLVSPGEFMPAVERYQLAARVDRWVIKKALAWMAEHQERVELCCINLSGQSVGDATFLSQVLQAMDQAPVRCDRLCFEITETAAMGDLAAANRFFQAMRARGCRFALDDFGSGLSSYAYLRELAVDMLKIDGQFVKNMADDPVSFAMVRSIHEIGCLMGKKTVAEFAESQAVVDLLTGLGVHFAQGYALARPAPLDELLQESVVQ